MNKHSVKSFIIPKLKYGANSAIATSINYLVFFSLVEFVVSIPVVLAQVIAYSTAVVVNFFLQKAFVFELHRRVATAFHLSVIFSVIGLGLSTLIIYLLIQLPFFEEHLLAAKVITTSTVFLYNFYSKRYAFERKKLFEPNE
ncbi:MAG: GtrA family protein [Balneola sp.]|nr:MAG: GtrA family protein [Balneola sp.]